MQNEARYKSSVRADETLSFLIVQPEKGKRMKELCETLVAKPEGIFELPLHGLHVWVLDKEGGTELTKLSKLDLARAVLVDLRQQVL